MIAKLKAAEPALRAHGAAALYLFGSYARNEARPGSDVDVFIDKDRSRKFGFDEFMDIISSSESNSALMSTTVPARVSIHSYAHRSSAMPSESSKWHDSRPGYGCLISGKR